MASGDQRREHRHRQRPGQHGVELRIGDQPAVLRQRQVALHREEAVVLVQAAPQQRGEPGDQRGGQQQPGQQRNHPSQPRRHRLGQHRADRDERVDEPPHGRPRVDGRSCHCSDTERECMVRPA